jgi:hypothetical protein
MTVITVRSLHVIMAGFLERVNFGSLFRLISRSQFDEEELIERDMYHLICQARVKLTLLLPWSIDRRSNCCPGDAAACRSMLLCDQSLTTLHVFLDAVVGNCVHKS